MPTPPEGFRHHTPLTVRFADLDVLGHVNHAKYLTYMEQGRIRYAKEVFQQEGDWDQLGMILAKAVVDYLLPLAFGEQISVYTRCSRLGNKSFDLEYVLLRANGDVAARGVTTMVSYDYRSGQSVPVSDARRERILAYEPSLGG